MSKKYKGLVGNKNAKIYDKPQNSYLSLRVNEDDKRAWQEHAKRKGLSLNALIIQLLNADLKNN